MNRPQPLVSDADGGDTRQRLLLTALHLYATQGLQAVSLRSISAAAGSRNSAAMHYHFHNKMGVMQALVELIAAELASVDKKLRAGQSAPTSLRQACQATLLPLLQLPGTQPWGKDAVRFISRLVSESDPEIAELVNRVFAPFWQRLDQALAAQLPQLPAPVRQLRLMFMSTNIFHGAAEVAWLAHSPLGDMSRHFDEDSLLENLLDYLLGGLQAPTSSNTGPVTE
jgi:AcrR family transcriptional regulator